MKRHFLKFGFCFLLLEAWVSAVFPERPLKKPEESMIWIMFSLPPANIHPGVSLDHYFALKADFNIRGWFHWGTNQQNGNWSAYAYLAEVSNHAGTAMGGGVTCSFLMEGENGLDNEKLMRMVSRTPAGEPVHWQNDTTKTEYHTAIENTEYRTYLLSIIRRQIDAGIAHIFIDENDGSANRMNGFTDQCMEEFRYFLLNKYMAGKGWRMDDPRWKSHFDIDLSDTVVCPDGTMASFSYRAYLRKRNLALKYSQINTKNADEDPLVKALYSAEANPLAPEWGDPWEWWDLKRRGRDLSYTLKKINAFWLWLRTAVRNYASSQGKTVWLCVNGVNEGVDFQLMGLWERNPQDENGRLKVGPSYVEEIREAIAWSDSTLGRRVPLVVNNDMNEAFCWTYTPEDRVTWLRIYAAEIFASGAFYCWAPYGYEGWANLNCWTNGTKEVIDHLISWYRSNEQLYLGAEWIGCDRVSAGGPTTCTMLKKDRKLIVNVINKLAEGNRLIPQTGLGVSVDVPKFRSVYAVSPDFQGEKAIPFSRRGGRVVCSLDTLEAYTVLVFEMR